MQERARNAGQGPTLGPTAPVAPKPATSQRTRSALTMLGLYVLSFVVMFAGWGLRDLPGFFAHPIRLVFVVCTVAAAVIVLLWMPDVQSFRKGAESVGNWLTALWMILGLLAMFFFPFSDRRGLLVIQADTWRYVGFAMFLVGATVRLAAARILGRQFSGLVTVQEGHRLVDSGIYSVIRHPMYLGLLLSMPGFALIFRSWLVIPLAGVSAVFVLLRMREEEQLLRKHFGQEFESYRRRTRRLIPFLY